MTIWLTLATKNQAKREQFLRDLKPECFGVRTAQIAKQSAQLTNIVRRLIKHG